MRHEDEAQPLLESKVDLFRMIWKTVALTQLIMCLTLMLKIDFRISWIFCSVLFLLCNIAVVLIGNLWIHSYQTFQIYRIAKIAFLIQVNSTFLLNLSAILLCARLDQLIDIHIVIILLPIIIWLMILILFLIFLQPGLPPQLIYISYVYYFCMLAFVIAIVIVEGLKAPYIYATIFPILALSFHLLIWTSELQKDRIPTYILLIVLIYTFGIGTYIIGLQEPPRKSILYSLMGPLCLVAGLQFVVYS
ncbi:hypothetical protein pb186bvf_020037 [Paramecium bursaria]